MSIRNLLRAPLAVGLAVLAVAAARFNKRRTNDIGTGAVKRQRDEGTHARVEELTRWSRHLLTVAEEEKARVARDMHDRLGSSLTAVNLDLFWIQQRLADQPGVVNRLARAREVLASTIQMERGIMHELRPTALDTLGLNAAIESHAAEFSRSNSIPVETELTDTLPALAKGTPIALFRIYEEALTNAARHANAASIRIVLSAEPSCMVLDISDDGSGIDLSARGGRPTSIGLLGMHERAAAVGATLRIERGANGRGTVVKVILPCQDAEPSTGITC